MRRLVIALVQTNLAELTSSVDPVAAEVLTEMVTPPRQIRMHPSYPLRQPRKTNQLMLMWRTLMLNKKDSFPTSPRLPQRPSVGFKLVELKDYSQFSTKHLTVSRTVKISSLGT